MRKFYIVLLTLLTLFVGFVTIDSIWLNNRQNAMAYNVDTSNQIDYDELSYFDMSEYYDYLDTHDDVYPRDVNIVIESNAFAVAEGGHQVFSSYQDKNDVLLTDADSRVTWSVYVEDGGFYNLLINYYPYEGRSASIERALYINDDIPFSGADNLTFQRIWGNDGAIIQDVNDNDIRPSQVELPMWTSSYFKDHIGYVNDPYAFYFEEGVNTITLEGIREPLMIESIEIRSTSTLKSYAEIADGYEFNNYQKTELDLSFIQAEEHAYSSSPTLYPLNDRTSSKTVPSNPKLVRLNTIGGYNWRVANDFIAWEFEVEESGLYAISLRVKQKLATGMNVYRNIYIDDQIPFKEMKNYAFASSNDWRMQTLGTQDEAYLFYLEKGTHTLKMEVSLGDYGPLIGQVQSSISNLNKLYREILVYTGPEPDQYRDYQLTDRVNNLLGRLQDERDNLNAIREKIIEISGSKSEKTGILDTVILQLEDFIETPRNIHKNLSTYNSNISSLGTLVLLLSAQPLEIDYFALHNPSDQLPLANESTLESIWFSFRSFLATFNTDYSNLGQTEDFETNESIEVWLSIGRDQANVLRKLIDESFTLETGIKIDLKLVNGAVLLPATLSNVGPDVAMGLGNSIPVNYAMRNAVYDISQFDDFDEVTTRFKDSAIVPFEYEGGHYALPEQQIFLMMFYRTDIFEELGLTPPNTWDEVITLIPDLQKHNLEFYLPIPISQGPVMNLPPNPVYATLFYQNDGEFYIDNNLRSGFNEAKGPEIFEMWTQFYTDYSFPVEANFVNRFRSGQMPIGLSYYNVYNVLSVFAPEIRGKWDFLPVPGTLDTDEAGLPYIRRETVSTGTATMIMENCDNKEAAWEYLKWWTSTDTQVQFGREMEGILGAAARYPSANVEAMSQLPWTVEEYSKLDQQWDWVRGIPEVPGGYMTGRHLDNAFRLVYNESSNPRETIYDYVQIINDEIAKKRREFGLD
ncbi:MAG: extracellular solute-binding protein [Candidatus Izimaplasma sp.]|nr:extracellular solute-binding protein [Candidatus Izimaplasma bacterium]